MALFDDSKKKFEFFDKGFIYNGETYNYIDILHISYEGIVTDYKVNFVSVDELKEALCEIELKNGKTIKHKIEEKQYLVGFSQNKTAQIKELQSVFVHLLKESFESRLAYYQQEIDQNFYFSWKGAIGEDMFRVYPYLFIVRTRDGTTFSVENSNFSRNSNEFIMTHKEASPDLTLGSKLVRKMLRIGMEIESRLTTKRDPDIFYYLLNKYMGIRFS